MYAVTAGKSRRLMEKLDGAEYTAKARRAATAIGELIFFCTFFTFSVEYTRDVAYLSIVCCICHSSTVTSATRDSDKWRTKSTKPACPCRYQCPIFKTS